MQITKENLIQLDKTDPLRNFRKKFHVPEGFVYFDGNSLGVLPEITKERMQEVIEHEWGEGLINSWLTGWGDAPKRIGDKIATLIGADFGEVIAADSTSINIFKVVVAALQANPTRKVVLSDSDNFPTDLYMLQGLESFAPDKIKVKITESFDIDNQLNEEVSALLLTEVHYKTGLITNMKEVTKKAHEVGALVIWDLSHSIGSIPIDLNGCEADFAIGCGYKFLNGGPGAPGFLFAAKKHHESSKPILSGWFGHREPFAFSGEYISAEDINQFQCGTPPVLGLAALECGVDLLCNVDFEDLRFKSKKLGAILISLMKDMCNMHGFTLISPQNDEKRAGHVSFSHEKGYEISRALKSRGIICDFRTPDVIRFGITPLYLRYQDIYYAVEQIKIVMESADWRKEEYLVRDSYT